MKLYDIMGRWRHGRGVSCGVEWPGGANEPQSVETDDKRIYIFIIIIFT